MTIATERRAVEIDFLCNHIRFENFDCGNALLNYDQESSVELRGDPGTKTVIVAHLNDRVVGYVIVSVSEIGTEKKKRPAFLIAAIAVDRGHSGRRLGLRLLERALRLVVERQSTWKFSRILIFAGFDGQYEPILKRFGLTAVEGEFGLWSWPFEDDEGYH